MLLTLRAAACNNPRRQPSMPRRRIEPGDLISIDGGFTRTLSVHSALSFRWSYVGHCKQTATTPAMSNIVCFIVKSRGCPVPKGEQVFVFVEPSLPLRDVGSLRETTSVYSRQLRNRQRDSTQSTGPALRL